MIIQHTPTPLQLAPELRAVYEQIASNFAYINSKEEELITLKELVTVLEYTQAALGVTNSRSDKHSQSTPKVHVHQSAGRVAEIVWQRLMEWTVHSESGLGLVKAGKITPLTHAIVTSEMQRLCAAQSDFHWARLRSIVDGMIKHFTEVVLSDGLLGDNAKTYQEQLDNIGGHWFRKTAALHTGIGFHTAVSAVFKVCSIFSESYWLPLEQKTCFTAEFRPFSHLLAYLASCHLVILHATDGILWDSAGVKPTDAWAYRSSNSNDNDGGWYIRSSAIRGVICRSLVHYDTMPKEPRTGCPALKSWGSLDGRLITEVQMWIIQIFERYAIPPLISSKKTRN